MGNLEKEGLALRFRAKMAPGGRHEGSLSCLSKLLIGSLDFHAHRQHVITIDCCYNEAHDDLTFNVIGAIMACYNLTFNVIGATIESPSQNPLACLYKPRACGNKAELLRRNPCRLWLSLGR